MPDQKKIILVIEDDSNIRADIIKILTIVGYNTIDAFDGQDGYDKAIAFKPNLIISDIMMPRMSGYDVFNKLRDNFETSSIPFLFLSAKSTKDDIREGMNLGADDYLPKPFDIKDLIKAVEARLKKKEITDINYSKRYDELRNALHQAVPHEIRTPLSTILSYSDYIVKNIEKLSTAKIGEMVKSINEDGERVLSLFENFLFYSKLQNIILNPQEQLKFRGKSTTAIENRIESIAKILAKKAGRELDFEMNIEDAICDILDEHFFKLIDELISNSIKFSKKDTKIQIKTQRINNSLVNISIRDSGRGMTNEEIDKIDAFVQFNRRVYEQQGAGLGLAICKSILKIYDSELKINSVQGEFTDVSFQLKIIE